MSETSSVMHPMAPEHMPYFIPTASGEDAMFTTVFYFAIILAFVVGTLYLRLHALPERMAHGSSRTQFQLVAIMALLALFTHNMIFWVLALLLAATQLPDFLTPVTSGARSLAKLAGRDYEGDLSEEFDHHPGEDPIEQVAEAPEPQETEAQNTGTKDTKDEG